jgi:hypothetical protein
MAFRRQERTFLAAPSFDGEKAVVNDVREVGCRDLSHAAGQGAIIQNDDALARLGQHIAGGKPSNSGPDDAHIGLNVLSELLGRRHLMRRGPNGIGFRFKCW